MKDRGVRDALGGLLLLLAVCALAWCGFQTATGRWHATPVLSGSMRPGFQPGDVVVTHRVPVSDLRVRDVIVFHPPNDAQGQTVHRIVKLKVKHGTTLVTTRGDANTVDDPAVTALKDASAYRVVRVVPLVGYPAVWLSGGHHGLLVIGLGILLLVGAAAIVVRPEQAPPGRPLDDRDHAQADPAPDEADAESAGSHEVTVPTP